MKVWKWLLVLVIVAAIVFVLFKSRADKEKSEVRFGFDWVCFGFVFSSAKRDNFLYSLVK